MVFKNRGAAKIWKEGKGRREEKREYETAPKAAKCLLFSSLLLSSPSLSLSLFYFYFFFM